MTDIEKAVFVAVFARASPRSMDALRLACEAVVDLRTARFSDTDYKLIIDEIQGRENRCVCGQPLDPNTGWGRGGYCSTACRDRSRG